MASLSNDPNGRRRIQFIDANGERKTIRLGKMAKRNAETVKGHVEELVGSSITSDPPRDSTSRWLADLDSVLYDKLVAVGLAKAREIATLGEFTRRYIDGRSDIKPRTRINLERVRRYLLECFDADRPMREFTKGDAEDFRQFLINDGKAENTTRRAIGRARQFFRAAQDRELIRLNPFEGMVAAVRANVDRFHFVSRSDSEKIIQACPNTEWKMIFVLARYGGLRCPSEVLALKWDDINWEHKKIRVPSPKTEHHDGKGSRTIPLFPELQDHLLAGFDEADEGAEFVITRYRNSNANLRTQLLRIIDRAGVERWEKPFQNLRSTRETELAEDFSMHVVCTWIGNSQPIAMQHYMQVTDEHFERACRGNKQEKGEAKAAQNAAQTTHETARSHRKHGREERSEAVEPSTDIAEVRRTSRYVENEKVPPEGLEPSTR